jgi:hypothetical protein
LSVVDWGGDPVAESGLLTISPIHLNISGVARTVTFTVRMELVDPVGPQPFQFLKNGDAACQQPTGTTSGLVLDCQYPVPVDNLGDGTLAPHPLTITPITAASATTDAGGEVQVSITGDVGGTAGTTRLIDLHRHAHLTVSAPGSIGGHVGDVVDVPWTVTNTGPDELPGFRALFTLSAPPGTEWIGPAPALCDPPVVPKSLSGCTNGTVLVPGDSLTDTWRLKIVSRVVGTGHITAQINNEWWPPNLVITDPTGGQGSDAVINVRVRPSGNYVPLGPVATVSRCTRALMCSHHAWPAATNSVKLPYSPRRFVSFDTRSALAIRTVASTPPLDSGSNGSHEYTVAPWCRPAATTVG